MNDKAAPSLLDMNCSKPPGLRCPRQMDTESEDRFRDDGRSSAEITHTSAGGDDSDAMCKVTADHLREGGVERIMTARHVPKALPYPNIA
jgi:hypothetical protein